MSGKKAGPPKIVFTDDMLQKVESLAANGLTKEQIAHSLGICYMTLNRRAKEDSKICDAIKKGRSKGIATITNSLFLQAKGGNLGAICFYLKNVDAENWRDKKDHELTGPGGGPIQTIELTIIEPEIKT